MRKLLTLSTLFMVTCSAQDATQSAFDRMDKLIRGESGSSSTPSGFSVVARSGQTGQAATAEFPAARGARTAFSGAMRQVRPYFDQAPVLLSAIGDPNDQQVQGFFSAVYHGTPVRGMMVVSARNGAGHAAMLFDRADLFIRSLPGLSKQMSAALPTGGAGGAGGGGAEPVPQLQRTPLPDGSGSIGLAPGWQITGSFQGVVDAVGPNGEAMSLGGHSPVYNYPGPNHMFGPYRSPWPALVHFFDASNGNVFSTGRGSMRLLEQAAGQFPGGESAWLAFEMSMGGRSGRGLALVNTKRLPDGSWFFYSSYVHAPSSVYARVLPTMIAMWKSWGVNQEIYQGRMDAALRSMRETYAIIQEIHDNTNRTYANTNVAWDETIRGVTMVEDMDQRARGEFDSMDAQRIVDEMNARGYHWRLVPLNELTH